MGIGTLHHVSHESAVRVSGSLLKPGESCSASGVRIIQRVQRCLKVSGWQIRFACVSVGSDEMDDNSPDQRRSGELFAFGGHTRATHSRTRRTGSRYRGRVRRAPLTKRGANAPTSWSGVASVQLFHECADQHSSTVPPSSRMPRSTGEEAHGLHRVTDNRGLLSGRFGFSGDGYSHCSEERGLHDWGWWTCCEHRRFCSRGGP